MESKISKHQEYQSSKGLSKEGGVIERNLTLDWRIIMRYLELQIEEGKGVELKKREPGQRGSLPKLGDLEENYI